MHVSITLFILSLLLPNIYSVTDNSYQIRAEHGKTILLVRHAEKCLGQGSDPALTPAGKARAQDLVRTLGDFEIDKIYSTPFVRTRDTARPLAEHFGVPVKETPVSNTFLGDLADEIKNSSDSVVVVVGHSNTTPTLINLLTGSQMGDMDEDVYDILFVVSLRDNETASLMQFRYGARSAALAECS